MEDYVKEAQRVMQSLKKNKEGKVDLEKGKITLTISQIRKLLAAVISVNTQIKVLEMQEQLKPQQKKIEAEINYLIVKFIYQIGKDKTNSVRTFVEKAKLIEKLESINGDVIKFKEFARYMEALVAFHKFYGGKD